MSNSMTDLDKILRLIENVDPADRAGLDEIDARVWCYLKDRAYHGGDGKGRFAYNLHYPLSMPHPRKRINSDERYTRSRDALKAIRPEGWVWNIGDNRSADGWQTEKPVFVCTMSPDGIWETDYVKDFPTEELAELHAILQAIQHERQRDK